MCSSVPLSQVCLLCTTVPKLSSNYDFVVVFSAWSPEQTSPSLRPMDIEEGNILYVAVTRAKKSLILSRALAKLLKDAGEHFVYPSVEHSQMVSLCLMHF
jgi:superfamily I DNA/RNA helicase